MRNSNSDGAATVPASSADTRRYGCRAWGWWVFEVGERPPKQQELRLAELGELTDEELAEISERANVARAQVGTDAEHRGPNYFPDRRAIEVRERISAIRKRRTWVAK